MSNRPVIQNAIAQAFKGMFIGDAVAMPVHWYYDVPAIKRDFDGWITKYEKPKDSHPTSYLRMSNAGGSGRESGAREAPVIGNVILHGKQDAWKETAAKSHYHQGMDAGDNTLNCLCAFQVMKTISSSGPNCDSQETLKRVFRDYVEFMTTPDSHNDTYAESWHRMFFRDWLQAGKPTEKNALYNFLSDRSARVMRMPQDKQLVVIGAFVVPTPIILFNIHRSLEEVTRIADDFLRRTHPVADIEEPFHQYIGILHAIVRGASLKDEAERVLADLLGPAAKSMMQAFDRQLEKVPDKLSAFQTLGEQMGIACYIGGAFVNVLHICRHYYDDFQGGILTNVNIGGENCHRGSVVGALLGAACGASGKTIPDKWTNGLKLNSSLDEILRS